MMNYETYFGINKTYSGGSDIKNLPANAGDIGEVVSIPRLGISPGGKAWEPTPVFLPGKSHG